MGVRWLTGFIDRPSASFALAAKFWSAVTGSAVSPARGDADEFATLVPPDGDAYLRLQRIAHGSGGCHLDLHTDDVDGLARQAVAAGAVEQHRDGTLVVLRSPAGLPWCVVSHHGEQRRPPPRVVDDAGSRQLVDQVCIDIPHTRFDEECAFWSAVTGWELRPSPVRAEFCFLERPAWSPLRLLLQRCDDEEPARAHLDLASSDIGRVVAWQERLGASVTARFEHWTVMADPTGVPYCVTARDPDTGRLAG